MKGSELKRWVKQQGCTFTEGRKHTLIQLRDKTSAMPRHPAAEIKTGTYDKILKDLGLKKDDQKEGS